MRNRCHLIVERELTHTCWYGHAVLPIAGLPDELLAEVFAWHILAVCGAVQHYYYPAIRPGFDLHSPRPTASVGPPPNPYSWLAIRHVCSAWRIVALAYPELSTRIVLTRPACVQDLLSRAGSLPLYIYQPGYNFLISHRNDVVASCNLVLPHLERIYRASLIFDDEPAYPKLQVSKGAVSKAWSLELRFRTTWDTESPIPPEYTFPELQHLSCRTVNITAFPSLLVPHLRSLKLVHCTAIPADDLFILLRSMPNLEELVLDHVISGRVHWVHFHDASSSPEVQDPISLPRLQRIRISHQGGSVGIPFLHRIEHPSSTAIDLRFRTLSSPPVCDCLLMLLLSKIDAWSCLEGPVAQSLHVTTGRGHLNFFFMVNLWRERLPLTTLQTSSRDSTFFQLSLDYDHKAFFAGLLRRLPLSGIATALLDDEASLWDVIKWDDLLSSLSSVEELALFYEIADRASARPNDATPRDIHAFCPRLTVLRVRELLLGDVYRVLTKPSPKRLTLARLARGFDAHADWEPNGKLPVHLAEKDFSYTVPDSAPSARLGAQAPSLRTWLSTRTSQISARLRRR